ncbi:MAG: prolyl oligopeptidase family serine peptidase [Clostridia bacterium]|nr:prolyl oligopeptidase family serine peptidase [Clostridia bacterium]
MMKKFTAVAICAVMLLVSVTAVLALDSEPFGIRFVKSTAYGWLFSERERMNTEKETEKPQGPEAPAEERPGMELPHPGTRPYDVNEVFEKHDLVTEEFTVRYRLYLPDDYDPDGSYPLLLFLHGAGERGDGNDVQLNEGVVDMFKDPESPVYGSIVIAPQCPAEEQWVNVPFEQGPYSVAGTPESEALLRAVALVLHIKEKYAVDSDRIYVTGISMGGYGTWDMLCRHKEIFAAGMPVCGGGDPDCRDILMDVPIYAFHGQRDGVVPMTGTGKMVSALKRAGAPYFMYKYYPDGQHDIWHAVYSDTEHMVWLFSQRLSARTGS